MTVPDTVDAESVLSFWFDELEPEKWWHKDPEIDRVIRQRFRATHLAARLNKLGDWRDTPPGRLAEIIVLDQFSRNLYRDTLEAFAADPQALALAQQAVRVGDDQRLTLGQRCFVYLPYMHSESVRIHEQAIELFKQPGLEHNLDFEYRHKAIIDRFGRYPHRNSILGRESTAEELEFLNQPGSAF